MKRLAVAVFGLMVASLAVGANWVEINDSIQKKTVTYMDVDSLEKINLHLVGSYQTPVHSVFLKEEYKKGSKQRNDGIARTVINYYVTCDPKAHFTRAAVRYDSKDEQIWSDKANISLLSQNDFSPTYPGTIGEFVNDTVCKKFN